MLTIPSLKDELIKADVEPESKQFRLNLRFDRAQYSRRELAAGTVIEQQYYWGYFPEVSISIQFFQYPAGRFSLLSAEACKAEVGKLLAADIERSSGKVSSEKDIKIGTVPGKELDYSAGLLHVQYNEDGEMEKMNGTGGATSWR